MNYKRLKWIWREKGLKMPQKQSKEVVMKYAFTIFLIIMVLFSATIAHTPGSKAFAALPNSTCMRDFLSCRTTSIATYSPEEMDDRIINDPEANACLLDCDVDLASCVISEIGAAIIVTIIKILT